MSESRQITFKLLAIDELGREVQCAAIYQLVALVKALQPIVAALPPEHVERAVKMLRSLFAPLVGLSASLPAPEAPPTVNVAIPYRGAHGESIATVQVSKIAGPAAAALAADAEAMVRELAADIRDGRFGASPT
jgi:hypothetical protein